MGGWRPSPEPLLRGRGLERIRGVAGKVQPAGRLEQTEGQPRDRPQENLLRSPDACGRGPTGTSADGRELSHPPGGEAALPRSQAARAPHPASQPATGQPGGAASICRSRTDRESACPPEACPRPLPAPSPPGSPQPLSWSPWATGTQSLDHVVPRSLHFSGPGAPVSRAGARSSLCLCSPTPAAALATGFTVRMCPLPLTGAPSPRTVASESHTCPR